MDTKPNYSTLQEQIQRLFRMQEMDFADPTEQGLKKQILNSVAKLPPPFQRRKNSNKIR